MITESPVTITFTFFDTRVLLSNSVGCSEILLLLMPLKSLLFLSMFYPLLLDFIGMDFIETIN